MCTPDDWTQTCFDLAEELLSQAGLNGTPDMFQLAASMGFPVVWDCDQTGRGRVMRLEQQITIFLRPDDRPERLQWAVAHEIGEAVIWRVVQRLGLDPTEILPRQREAMANQLANGLLLPARLWMAAVATHGRHLIRLKAVFPQASHELIAWRFLDSETPQIVTIVDQGIASRRRSNFSSRVPTVTSDELRCLEQSRTDGEAHCEQVHDLLPNAGRTQCTAWAIHEDDWQREILLTEIEIE